MSEAVTVNVDVLVVGGGGGGLAASIAASEGGAHVIVVEKDLRLSGNTALSSGSVPGAATRFQKAAGVEDSAEIFANDMLRQTEGTAPEHLVRLLANVSGPLVEWLVDVVGVPMEFVPDLKKVGHSVPRVHAPPGRSGEMLLHRLAHAAQSRGVTIATGTSARQLYLDSAGKVAGAVVQAGDEGDLETIRARKVILAANGFGANRSMLTKFIPELADVPYFGHRGNTGEAIDWCVSLGARLRNMQSYQGHAAVAYPHGSLVSWTLIEKGGFLTNASGRRFVDETRGYSACAPYVLKQPEAAAFAIFDARIHDYMQTHVPEYAELFSNGGVKMHSDIRELGRALEVDPDRLARTLEDFDKAPGAGLDAFGRSEFGMGPLRPPYYGVRVTAGLFHTQGGVDVDLNAQPLRDDGTPIENLYAVGGTAVGVSGSIGGDGYMSGNGLLAALGLGWIAGRHAAANL